MKKDLGEALGTWHLGEGTALGIGHIGISEAVYPMGARVGGGFTCIRISARAHGAARLEVIAEKAVAHFQRAELQRRVPGVSLADSLHAPATERQSFGLDTWVPLRDLSGRELWRQVRRRVSPLRGLGRSIRFPCGSRRRLRAVAALQLETRACAKLFWSAATPRKPFPQPLPSGKGLLKKR